MEKKTEKSKPKTAGLRGTEPTSMTGISSFTESNLQEVQTNRTSYTTPNTQTDKNRSKFTSSKKQRKHNKETSKKGTGDCDESKSSHTQIFRKDRYDNTFNKITSDEFCGLSESISGSSDTFQCVHGPEGKQYTEKGLLKRNLLKNLDPIPDDPKWTETCKLQHGWELAKKLEFLLRDPVGITQIERLQDLIREFAKVSSKGYKIDVLENVCTIIDYLHKSLHHMPCLRNDFILLLENMSKPIKYNTSSDVITYFDVFRSYIGYLGYLLIELEDEDLFDLVSKALIWQLSAPDSLRGHGSAQLRHVLVAAPSVLYDTVVRMTALADTRRFSTFLNIAFLLACDSVDNCLIMTKEHIIENVFYRFNPYFPERNLPEFEVNPADVCDFNVKLGASSVHMSLTMSFLLVMTVTLKKYVDENPRYRVLLPCPDDYAQRCFLWAYRYECRAPEHRHQRNTLTVIVNGLLDIYRDRLMIFADLLMPDVMTLSVLTEIPPPRNDWTSTVNFNTSQMDVCFKKLLIYLSVDFVKIYRYNNFMVESRHWILGLMYLLDPNLYQLRARWSQTLFAELRKAALQALVCTLPLVQPEAAKNYDLIRRIMWYIEWYSESPYELPVLYWCVRLLHVSISLRNTRTREVVMNDLYNSHGIIVILQLVNTLLEQKIPPLEKCQAVIALCLRLITSAVDNPVRLTCCVYPNLKWPGSTVSLCRKMLDIALYSLEKHFIVNNKWLISLLNFIWEAIIWKQEYRQIFLANNGIYKLLDLISMTPAPVQCIALAITVDITSTGNAVGQLVTWRSNYGAAAAHPNVVKRGSTIACLLASIFRDECHANGIALDENGILEDLDFYLISSDGRAAMNDPGFLENKSQKTVNCMAASDMAGSRLSKAFALLYMLSEDLKYKVDLADEAYNLYKNIKLASQDEVVLVLCAHYLTLKLNEVWLETHIQSQGFVPEDQLILDEFIHIGRGWAKEIRQQQLDVIEKEKMKEKEEECTLYSFLGRVRLNIALDALRQVRCVARSTDRDRIGHALLYDAVHAYHRRSLVMKALDARSVMKTYAPVLDDQNLMAQYIKMSNASKPEKGTSKPTSYNN